MEEEDGPECDFEVFFEADKKLVDSLPEDFDFRPFISILDIMDANKKIKASYVKILGYKENLTSCARSLIMIGTAEEELPNGNSGLCFDMAKEILDYCYTDSDDVMKELKYFAGRPKEA